MVSGVDSLTGGVVVGVADVVGLGAEPLPLDVLIVVGVVVVVGVGVEVGGWVAEAVIVYVPPALAVMRLG